VHRFQFSEEDWQLEDLAKLILEEMAGGMNAI